MEQFEHIGKIIQIFQERPACISNLPCLPLKTHFDIQIAGNSIDRDFRTYSIAISIRNITISHKNDKVINDLINIHFPALNGSRTSKWIGKPCSLDDEGNLLNKPIWYTTIHGKMAE